MVFFNKALMILSSFWLYVAAKVSVLLIYRADLAHSAWYLAPIGGVGVSLLNNITIGYPLVDFHNNRLAVTIHKHLISPQDRSSESYKIGAQGFCTSSICGVYGHNKF